MSKPNRCKEFPVSIRTAKDQTDGTDCPLSSWRSVLQRAVIDQLRLRSAQMPEHGSHCPIAAALCNSSDDLLVLGERVIVGRRPDGTLDQIAPDHEATHIVEQALNLDQQYVAGGFRNEIVEAPIEFGIRFPRGRVAHLLAQL